MKKYIFIFFVITNFYAQTSLSITQAIEIGLKNNLLIKSQKLRNDYAKSLEQSAYDLPKTVFNAEYGQINSNFNDQKFGLSQSFEFPMVYRNQKKLLEAETKLQTLYQNLKEIELKKQISHSFYSFLVLKQKQKLLKKADSIYSNWFEKANLRLQKGESNILEKTTAETQLSSIKNQLLDISAEIENTKIELKFLLNADQNYEPASESIKIMNIENDKNDISNQIISQQKNIIESETNVLKSKLIPEFLIGYYNTTFNGTGFEDNKRFHTAQFGLGIPIFGGSTKAKIKANKIATEIVDNELNNNQNHLTVKALKLENLIISYQKNSEYFEKTGLKNASKIIETANKQLSLGEINYLDYSLLLNQAFDIQNEYLNTVNNLNTNIIERKYLY